jgi:hypothetical protein
MCILLFGTKGRVRKGTGVIGTADREGAAVVRALATGASGEMAAVATASDTAVAAMIERLRLVEIDVLLSMLESDETNLDIRIAIKTSE